MVTEAQSFELSYAGIPFVLDDARVVRLDLGEDYEEEGMQTERQFQRKHQPMADLIDELNRLLPLDYLQDQDYPSDFPGKNLTGLARHTHIGNIPSPKVQIGDWYYPPTASKWSIFRGLATSSQAKAMLDAAGGGGTRTFRMKAVPQSTADNRISNYELVTLMHMLPPRPLAEHGGEFDGLYLITLVDERYWWQFDSVYLRQDKLRTWESAINEVAGSLGIQILGVNTDVWGFPEKDSDLWVNAENSAALLDAIAYNLGGVVVRSLDGQYSIMEPGQSTTIVNQNLALIGVAVGLERWWKKHGRPRRFQGK